MSGQAFHIGKANTRFAVFSFTLYKNGIADGIFLNTTTIYILWEVDDRMNFRLKKENVVDEGALAREKWSQELRLLKQQLDNNETLFNMTDDFDITAYTIHERAALEARYSYLIRLIRAYDEAQLANRQDIGLENAVIS